MVSAVDTDIAASTTVAQDRLDRRSRGARSTGWLWGLGTVVVVVVGGLVPLLFTPHYYWRGDTQIAYFGAYFHLGTELRQGHYPLMEPFAWRGGNHIVEGNFGLLSPIIMAIGIGATFVKNAITYLTIVKLVFLGISGLGGYLLTRSYGAPRPIAFVVGVLVPLSGFTLYLDAPTWFPGMVVSGLLALVWWSLRGCLLQGRNPLPALLLGALLATLGYVWGTGMLAVVVVACAVDALRTVGPRAALKCLALGVLIGVPAVVVRLPFVLSASVTTKLEGGIRHTGFGVTELNDLLLGTLPTNGAGSPLFYVSWLLPFLVFVDWRTFRRTSSDLAGLLIVWVVAILWAFSPDHMGPLRYPMRLVPYVVLCTVLFGALAFARARFQRLSGRRLLLALFITGMSGFISASAAPPYWRQQLAVTLLVSVGLTALWLMLRRPSPEPASLGRRFGMVEAAAAFVGLWTVVVIGVQHHYEPETYAVDRGMPGAISDYKKQLPGAQGDIFMVGHVDASVEPGEKPAPLVLIANSWYVSGLRMNNVHANTGDRAYIRRYCINYLGFTCRRALSTLFSTEPRTGRLRVDLLSVTSIVLLKSDIPAKVANHPPRGWHVANNGPMSVIWVRDKPVPTAGGVVWTSKGLHISAVARDDETVRLKVGDVPAGGGDIVLSRVDWPGYQVTNAKVAEPVDDYLLTLHVSSTDAHREIVARYAPPHWPLLLASLAVAGLISLGWSIAAAAAPILRRRQASPDHAGTEEALGRPGTAQR
jgi:hypothetical protein